MTKKNITKQNKTKKHEKNEVYGVDNNYLIKREGLREKHMHKFVNILKNAIYNESI